MVHPRANISIQLNRNQSICFAIGVVNVSLTLWMFFIYVAELMTLRIILFYVEAYQWLIQSTESPALSTQPIMCSSWHSKRFNFSAILMPLKFTLNNCSSCIGDREWKSTGVITSYVQKSLSTSWWRLEKLAVFSCWPSDWCFYLVITRKILPN